MLSLLQLQNLLSPQDALLWSTGVKRLNDLCMEAQRLEFSLLLDAEQSNRQPAIDSLFHLMAQEHNHISRQSSRPTIYNTYQMYLKSSTEALRAQFEVARDRNYTFAAKIVRGAYVRAETERCLAQGIPCLLHNCKADTDRAYDAAVEYALKQRSMHCERTAAIMVATHNRKSIEDAVALMHDLGLAKADSSICFAQILGMSDHLTFALGQSGYNALKLVPFGDFNIVFPWLLRRLDENKVG